MWLGLFQLLNRNIEQDCRLSAEDVYKILIEQGEEIGLATVYRVLNQFDDAGILIATISKVENLYLKSVTKITTTTLCV